ncbi:MAG: lasso peptide isopeptide bond-forming cyclase, partial [Candidatus Omnitrophota bacterium]
MSGIAGVLKLDGCPPNIELLGRMISALEHRGCDGARRWQEGAVALGHCALNSTLESFDELQPLEDPSGGAVVAFDGRLDNRGELISLLCSKVHFNPTKTDAELVLKSYLCWGEDCPRRILGDFAFAIWDKRKQQLFCARDPIGVKPFYYCFDGNKFLFCSEIQPLFKDATVHVEPNIPLIAR